MEQIEKYMAKHQFLEADKKKVRDFLRCEQAVSAKLTRNDLLWVNRMGVPGVIGRGQLGIQDNFA